MAIARIIFDVNSEAALRGIMEHLPKSGSGIAAIKIEYFDDAAPRRSNVAGDKKPRKSSKNNNQPNKGSALNKLIFTHFGNGLEFNYADAAKVADAAGFFTNSVSTTIHRLKKQGFITKTGSGRYKVIKVQDEVA